MDTRADPLQKEEARTARIFGNSTQIKHVKLMDLREEIQDGNAALIAILRTVDAEIMKLKSKTAFETLREGITNDLGKTIDSAYKRRFKS